jgi:hypothetical protein
VIGEAIFRHMILCRDNKLVFVEFQSPVIGEAIFRALL